MRRLGMNRLVFACGVLLAAGPATAGVSIGDKLTPFSLESYEGKEVNLASYAGKRAVLLVFVATRCPVSNAYNDRMEAIARDYAPRGVAFVGINANKEESPAEIADHAKTHGLTFPILKDTRNAEADAFGARVTPEAYLYDSTWTLRYHGRIDDNMRSDHVTTSDLRTALDAVLSGQDVATKETKAFGCSIKRVER
jgi:peroxiredoxin